MNVDMGWRRACVTRAQTIARGVRIIDLAVDGRLPRIAPGGFADFMVAQGGAPAVRSFDCIPAPHGRVRITIGTPDHDDDGLRFMWSLVEGAAVRMRVCEETARAGRGANRRQKVFGMVAGAGATHSRSCLSQPTGETMVQ
jgi:vanillate O-demethylase ferredoxin subunit